ALDVLHLYPQIRSHTLGAVHALGRSKKHGILAVVPVKAAEGNLSVLRLRGDASRMVESQRIGDLRRLPCHGNRPGSAVLQKLAVRNIRMADGPVREEAADLSHACRLHQKGGDGS